MFGEQDIIGHSIGKMDIKNRIIIPSYTKAEHRDKIVLQRITFQGEQALKLFAYDKFLEIIRRYRELQNTAPDIQEYEKYSKKIEEMYLNLDYYKELDKQKKLLIPSLLINELNWEDVDTVLLNGLGDSLLVRKKNK